MLAQTFLSAALSFVALASAAPWGSEYYGPKTHLVAVGENGLTYTPNFVNADVGDLVKFEFHPMNHTVTQSSFDYPCTAIDGGIDSDFNPVPAGSYDFKTFEITVQVKTPLWFYCRQDHHCQQGMGFGINPPPKGNTIDAFIAKAKASAKK
ncbi:hypothetical protein P7C70_g114, partial [Phenoliferia sp. Uapishka_3]